MRIKQFSSSLLTEHLQTLRVAIMTLIALAFVLAVPSAAAMPRSADLKTQANLAKALETQIPNAVLSVHVSNGTATLSGTVGRLCDRMLAEEIALQTPGIEAVRDDSDLIVMPVSNEELSRQLSDRVHYSRAEAGFSFPKVKLTVKDGVVTAEGEVDDAVEHAMLRAMIASEDGVKGLVDHVQVSWTGDPDEETRIAVAKALDGKPVQAKVEFGVVHLLGSVPTQQEAAAIANKVRGLSGVVGVENELQVKPSPLADLQLSSFINDDVHR